MYTYQVLWEDDSHFFHLSEFTDNYYSEDYKMIEEGFSYHQDVAGLDFWHVHSFRIKSPKTGKVMDITLHGRPVAL